MKENEQWVLESGSIDFPLADTHNTTRSFSLSLSLSFSSTPEERRTGRPSHMKAPVQVPLGGQILVSYEKHSLGCCPIKPVPERSRALACSKRTLFHLGLALSLPLGWGQATAATSSPTAFFLLGSCGSSRGRAFLLRGISAAASAATTAAAAFLLLEPGGSSSGHGRPLLLPVAGAAAGGGEPPPPPSFLTPMAGCFFALLLALASSSSFFICCLWEGWGGINIGEMAGRKTCRPSCYWPVNDVSAMHT